MKNIWHQRAWVLVAALCLAPACLAQTAPARYPLSREAVANTLLTTGVSLTPAEIILPAALTTSVPAPQLTVDGADLAGPTQLRVRLACSGPGQCLPFMAIAEFHDRASALAAKQKLAFRPTSTRATQNTAAETLRAGQHATLLLEDERMRISLPVISIDTGAPGTEVRVASLDRKQTYHGVVTDAGTVRGALP